MENFQPALPRRVDLWENVVDALRQAIVRGELPGGTRLVEADLSDRLGVSRGPVREALSRLEQEGLVEALPRRGLIVVGVGVDDVAEVYDLRRVLEGRAARLAARAADATALERLRRMVEEMRADAPRRPEAIGQDDLDFHRELVRASGNRRLLAAWEPIAGTARAMLAVSIDEGEARDIADAHQTVVDALGAGDPDRAERAIGAHLDAAQRAVRAAMAAAHRAGPAPERASARRR